MLYYQCFCEKNCVQIQVSEIIKECGIEFKVLYYDKKVFHLIVLIMDYQIIDKTL